MNTHIDCLGLMCPVPVVKAQIIYKKMIKGDTVSILTDHSCTANNIRDAFMQMECEIHVEEETNGIWKITLKKI